MSSTMQISNAKQLLESERNTVINLLSLFLVSMFLLPCIGYSPLQAGQIIETNNSQFTIRFDAVKGGVISLKRHHDTCDTEYIKNGHLLGDAMIGYRVSGSAWKSIRLSGIDDGYKVDVISDKEFQVKYTLSGGLVLTKRQTLNDDNLTMVMTFHNKSDKPIEIGDLALPLRMNTDYVGGDLMDEKAVARTYQNRLNRHRLINGHGSFMFWMRANGVGPYLVLLPLPGTGLEYFDSDYPAFIHSARSGSSETRGTWRQKHTGIVLEPAGAENDSVSYGFKYVWGSDYQGVREALYQNGGFDIHVVPGMTMPINLPVQFALRTKNRIHAVRPEHPSQTSIEYLGEKDDDLHIYRARFSRLGENLFTVTYNENCSMILEFFVTEPLETLYKKRAAFIAQNQQHYTEKWYDGLFSLWDMREKVLRGPDNTGGLQDYMVGGSDDPSNSKCVYLAEKNVVHPDSAEIKALEYFLKQFVWGKLQRTDEACPHPYGIYGSENWFLNRNTRWGTTDAAKIERLEKQFMVPIGTGLGRERMWRTFDYTTYIMLYYNMYRIARQYPDRVDYLDAKGYLERAFGTSKAFFQVPYSIYMMGKPLWSHQGYSDWAYKLGNFHEKYIGDVIAALKQEGMPAKAEWLRNEWEKKVKYFIYDDPHPFGSEFVFDRTAFESTHAIARYAIRHPLQPDHNLWYDKNKKIWYSHPEINPADAFDFLERQIQANIAMRGWLETSYYYLGSARVGGNTLDYMSQMAGWSILDYALYFSEEPATYMRLGYASLLSSWALVNSGTPASNYGYWYPGKENDGAVGWNFQTEKYGRTWAHGYTSRGPWYYDGEIDHGLAGGVKAAATVVIEDPIFGKIAYGGTLNVTEDTYHILPGDGVRRRLHYIDNDRRFHLQLNTDGFAKGKTLKIKSDWSEIDFIIENRSQKDHTFEFDIAGLPMGEYILLKNGNLEAILYFENRDTRRCYTRFVDDNECLITIRRKKY